jgi:hypothetical protein
MRSNAKRQSSMKPPPVLLKHAGHPPPSSRSSSTLETPSLLFALPVQHQEQCQYMMISKANQTPVIHKGPPKACRAFIPYQAAEAHLPSSPSSGEQRRYMMISKANGAPVIHKATTGPPTASKNMLSWAAGRELALVACFGGIALPCH